jgi:hypothetical protein
LSEAHFAEPIPFEAEVAGSRDAVERWIRAWKETQVRYAEPTAAIEAQGGAAWKVRGRAYRFRDVRYPEIRQRDPRGLLPPWARRAPAEFAHREPRLWRFVSETRRLAPSARPLLEIRRELLTLKPRLEFFIAKTAHN